MKYLKEKGIPVPTFPKAAHHIVAIHADAAEATRKLLEQFGIGENELNSAANGVFLPTDPLQNPNGSTLHIGSHKAEYHEYVYNYLNDKIDYFKRTNQNITQTQIYTWIDDIRQDLLSGQLSLN